MRGGRTRAVAGRRVCDAALRREVESLLAHEGGAAFLSTPAVANGVGARIRIGQALGPYVISADPDRLARFEREARMLASLNHPHIGAIYGLEDVDGIPALVLELVEGDTLAERLSRVGRALSGLPSAPGPIGCGLPLEEAVATKKSIREPIGRIRPLI